MFTDDKNLTPVGIWLKRKLQWVDANTLPVDWLMIGLGVVLLALWILL
jgi:hypothetical protein